MGCCGSKDSKNEVHPEKKRRLSSADSNNNEKDVGEGTGKGKGNKSRKPLKPEDTPWRRQKQEPKEFAKEIEIVSKTVLAGHTQNVDLCGWHPNKPILFTAATDRRAYLWDFSGGLDKHKKTELELNISDAASCFQWAEGKGKKSTLAIGTDHGFIYLWSESGEKLDLYQPHSRAVAAVRQNPNKPEWVLSVSDIVCVYDSKEKSWALSAWNDAALTDAEWMGDGKRFLVADFNGGITMDNVSENQFMPITFPNYEPPVEIPEHQFLSHSGGVYRVRAHPADARLFASCSVDNTVKVWSADKESPVRTLDEHFGYVLDVQWVGPGGSSLASSSFDGTVKLWDPANGECTFTLEEHADKVAAISLTIDGRYLASAGHDGIVHLWAADAGLKVNSHEGPGRILRAEFSRHSDNFLAVTSYGSVEVLGLEFHERVEGEEVEEIEMVEDFGEIKPRGDDRRERHKERRSSHHKERRSSHHKERRDSHRDDRREDRHRERRESRDGHRDRRGGGQGRQ